MDFSKEKFVAFIRKMSADFPDEILRYYLFEYSKKYDDNLVLQEPLLFIYLRCQMYIQYGFPLIIFLYLILLYLTN